MKNSMRSAFGLSLLFGSFVFANASEPCTYSDWAWDVNAQQAVDFQTVTTTKDQLSDQQRHPELPCSICREDMREVIIADLEPVLMCRVIAGAVEKALLQAAEEGFPINSLTGYRVGRTKGAIDPQGRRTEYSHHSFGLAIDINAEANGLYGNCIAFGAACRLRRGGRWNPANPASITPDSYIYGALRGVGLQWGGELYGRQKDFMHFSLSGD